MVIESWIYVSTISEGHLDQCFEADSFPIRLLPRLGISFVAPDSGPVTGGTLIAVVGNGFSQQGRLSCAFVGA